MKNKPSAAAAITAVGPVWTRLAPMVTIYQFRGW